MNSHELARQLLAGPDLPVELLLSTPHDTLYGDLGDCTVTIGTIDVVSARARGFPDTEAGNCVVLRSWKSSEDECYDDEDEG